MADGQISPYGWDPSSGITLQDKLREDLKTALRGKNGVARDTVRQVMSEFPGLTVPITLESGKKTTRPKRSEEITDDDIVGIVRKLIKSEKTLLEAKNENSSEYLRILENYLPKMASGEEILAWIRENLDLSQFKSPMQAIGPIMKHFGRQADGAQVREILQELSK